MARWLVLLALVSACNPPLTDRQYCTKQQMAWESAFPQLPQTDEQRMAFIDHCMMGIKAKHESGELDRSIACFDKIITGKGHAHEEYLAFKQCEAGSAATGSN